jgi:hypothetical protein
MTADDKIMKYQENIKALILNFSMPDLSKKTPIASLNNLK